MAWGRGGAWGGGVNADGGSLNANRVRGFEQSKFATPHWGT